MRIGIYGLPTSGKTYVLSRVDFMESISGSSFLRQYDPHFDEQPDHIKEEDRKAIARILLTKEHFIMDGHYAFGSNVVFTEDDGRLYDTFIYLYISPDLLRNRMKESERNQKYLACDIEKWQQDEIAGLREYCHRNDKDFYVIDNPSDFSSEQIDTIIDFVRSVSRGYSCRTFARECADVLLTRSDGDTFTLLDGDKTLTVEDSSNRVFGYKTHLYDGNFYTGYQAWKQFIEFEDYDVPDLNQLPVHINDYVLSAAKDNPVILTSGHPKVWRCISEELGMLCFSGNQMSAETKYFITKYLQEAGKKVVAYGDGMNDYFMLKQADEAYLIRKADGTISRSLKGRELEGIKIV